MEKMSMTVRMALGQRLRDARREHRRVEEQLKHHRSLVAGYDRALGGIDETIADLEEALGDEEASRWEA